MNNASGAAVVGGTLRRYEWKNLGINCFFFSIFSGLIREGESFLVGPLLDGAFLPAKVTTIHRYRVPRRIVHADQAASLSLLHIGGSRLRKVNYFILWIYFFLNEIN